MEKWEALYTIGGNVIWRSHCGKGGFPDGSDGKEFACIAGDLGLKFPLWKTAWDFLKKTKNRTTRWSSNSTAGYISEQGKKKSTWKCVSTPVAVLFTTVNIRKFIPDIYNTQYVAATQVSIDRTDEWIKEMWYTHLHMHSEYHSILKRNAVQPFAATWMDLESIILIK